jgi:hypothetical protein
MHRGQKLGSAGPIAGGITAEIGLFCAGSPWLRR